MVKVQDDASHAIDSEVREPADWCERSARPTARCERKPYVLKCSPAYPHKQKQKHKHKHKLEHEHERKRREGDGLVTVQGGGYTKSRHQGPVVKLTSDEVLIILPVLQHAHLPCPEHSVGRCFF